jgi:hypothetical protein
VLEDLKQEPPDRFRHDLGVLVSGAVPAPRSGGPGPSRSGG